MEQLSGLDSAFAFLESKSLPMHVGGVLIYDPSTASGGHVTFEQILDNLSTRIGQARALRSRMVRLPFDADRPWWVADEQVDLQYHVSHLALPKPADWRELSKQVSRFLARPLDMSRPLWELCVIEGLDGIGDLPAGAFAMVLKVHHASTDGVSGLELVSAIHDLSPAVDPVSTDATGGILESTSRVELLARSLPNVVSQPWRLLNAVGGVVPAVAGLIRKSDQDAKPAPKPGPTRFNGSIGAHRSSGGVRFELDSVKAVKNAVPGATVNDVALALVGGAVRRYLGGKGELPAESLITAMPVSVRSEDNTSSGNQVRVTTLPLCTDVADPLERVRRIHVAAAAKKSNGPGAQRLAGIADALPAGLMGLAGWLVGQLQLTEHMTLFHVGVTNVPGPPKPLYMTGARLVDIYGMALVADGLGLANMVSSYCGGLTIGFQSGSTMIPDPEHYEDCLRQSFAELVEAATCGDGTGPGRKSGRRSAPDADLHVATAATTPAKGE